MVLGNVLACAKQELHTSSSTQNPFARDSVQRKDPHDMFMTNFIELTYSATLPSTSLAHSSFLCIYCPPAVFLCYVDPSCRNSCAQMDLRSCSVLSARLWVDLGIYLHNTAAKNEARDWKPFGVKVFVFNNFEYNGNLISAWDSSGATAIEINRNNDTGERTFKMNN